MKKVARFRGGGTSEDNSMESQNSSTGEKIGIRTTGRIKKAKIVFDPSDNYVPRTHRPPSCSTASTASTISAHHSLDISEKRLQQQRLQNLDNRKGNQSYQSSSSLTLSDASGNSIDGEKCTICYRREPRKGVKKLIACIDCENNAHLSCMKIIFEDLGILRNKYRCDSCRTCASCFEGPEDGELVTCSKCIKSFHLSCHIPSVARFSLNSKWLCSKCITPKINNGTPLPAKSIRDIIIGDVKLPNSQALQQQQQQQEQQKQQPQQQQPQQQQPQQQQQLQQQQQQPSNVANKRNSSDNMSHTSHSQAKQMKTATQQLPPQQVQKHPTIPKPQEKVQTQTQLIRPQQQVVSQASINVEAKIQQDKETSQELSFSPNELLTEIPDVKGWSIKKVVEFFEKYFPNEAHVFQEHEIDGQSLLLLKRSDVIKKLPLKLGPSLRIYNLILKIQSQSNDPTIGW